MAGVSHWSAPKDSLALPPRPLLRSRLERSKAERVSRRGESVRRGVDVPGLMARLAGAPISWGVCEVPGWGLQLPPERVLAEMARLGVRATELGPQGWLPLDGARVRAALDRYGLRLVGGFVPVVVHEPVLGETRAQAARAGAQVAGA